MTTGEDPTMNMTEEEREEHNKAQLEKERAEQEGWRAIV
jgi:hypothetical protein